MANASNCPVARGEVDLRFYAERDGFWRELGLAAPARRALVNANILSLDDLRSVSVKDVSELHGMGPKALALLADALRK
jgi:hypothetical protein